MIRAGQNLSVMLAGAQLGITVCSILLGRVGEPAVAHLLETPFDLLGVPDAILHTVSFVIAITIVVVLHVLLGEMVPKNIAIAGPESAAMLLVPPYLAWVRMARPVIAVYDWCAHMTLRAVGVEAKTELENTVSTVELSEMIAESLSEGLLDPEEHNRLSRALQIRNRVVADVAVPLREVHAVPAAADGTGPTVRAIQQALEDSGYSGFPVTDTDGRFIGYVHIKDVLRLVNDTDAVVDLSMVRPLPQVPASLPLPDALSRLRRSNSHLALVTAADGSVTAMVALEDLVEDLVGTMRASDPRWLTCVLAETDWIDQGAGVPAPGRRSSSHRTFDVRRPASHIRCGTSCSATTACGRVSCASGIPASAWCSADRTARRRSATSSRTGYGRASRRRDGDLRAPAGSCRHRAVHRGSVARDGEPLPPG